MLASNSKHLIRVCLSSLPALIFFVSATVPRERDAVGLPIWYPWNPVARKRGRRVRARAVGPSLARGGMPALGSTLLQFRILIKPRRLRSSTRGFGGVRICPSYPDAAPREVMTKLASIFDGIQTPLVSTHLGPVSV